MAVTPFTPKQNATPMGLPDANVPQAPANMYLGMAANSIPQASVPSAPTVSSTSTSDIFHASSSPTIPGVKPPQAPTFDDSYQQKPWQDQLQLFQGDLGLAGHELQRATNQANLFKATGDTDAYNKAQTWIGQINTATGGRAQVPMPPQVPDPNQERFNQYQTQMNDLMGQLKSFAQPMNYNPATDPQAIAYKQYYDNLAKQNSQNAMETMNDRGLLNSSMTAGEVAKAQQDAGLAYGTKVADLGQQFYQRQQDQFNNTARLIGLVGDQQQRAIQNQQWNQEFGLRKQGQDFNQNMQTNEFQNKLQQQHIDLANFLTQQYGVPVNPTDDPTQAYAQVAGIPTVAARKIAMDAEKMGFDMAIQKATLENKINQTQAAIALNAAKAADLAGYHQVMAGAANARAAAAITSANAAASNAAVNKEKADNPQGKAPNLGQLSKGLQQTFGEYDALGHYKGIPDSQKAALRQSIIMMNLPDEHTDQLLGMFGLPTK